MDRTKFLKNTIEKHYKSIRSFAQEIGIPESTLRSTLNKENGIYTMTLNNVFKICKGLGISVDSLDPFQQSNYSIEDTRTFNKFNNLNDYHKETIEILIERLLDFEQNHITSESSNKEKTLMEQYDEWEEPDLLAAHGSENLTQDELERLYKDAEKGIKMLEKLKEKMDE